MRLCWILPIAAITCCTIPALALDIKDKTFITENAGKVVFSHSIHLKKKSRNSPNISCKGCHNNAMKSNAHYTMAQMYQGKSCGQCHNGKRAFALAKCTACHKVRNITFKVKETGPVLFKHNAHLQNKSECSTCHNALFKAGSNPRASMNEMEKGKSCGACHNGRNAFPLSDCSNCHPTKEITYIEKDAGNVIFSHNNHTGLYKCGECHTKIFNTIKSKIRVSMKEMEAGKSCGACHEGKTAFSVATDKDCDKCHKM
ncbi:MAG: cytochrome c3 family protein [Desulfuromonadaceae bacterium]|nr:cytochrome c3 family protein [Desulfuromonadaceae bacterium]